MTYDDPLQYLLERLRDNEARGGTRLLGYNGMAVMARQAARRMAPPASLRDTGGAILDGARAFAGGTLQDDVCLLLARRQQTTDR